MDIRVGNVAPVVLPTERGVAPTQFVEARVLATRPPRKRNAPPVGQRDRRESEVSADPPGGRVLILLIPDAKQLPAGFEEGQYRVFLRFAKK